MYCVKVLFGLGAINYRNMVLWPVLVKVEFKEIDEKLTCRFLLVLYSLVQVLFSPDGVDFIRLFEELD